MQDGCNGSFITKEGTIFYHGTTWHIKTGDTFSKFDESVETYVTTNEKVSEFFSGDLEDPNGDHVVIKLAAKKDLVLTRERGCDSDDKFDGVTSEGRITIGKYDDTIIFKPNGVLKFAAYKVKKKGKWSEYIEF